MMNNTAFEYIAKLQYKVKTMAARLDAFEAGEKYVSMKAEFRSHLAMTEREIKRLKLELGNAYAQMVTNRKGWMQVFDDMEKGHAEELLEKDRIIKELVERALKAERIVDEQKGMLKERAKELYQIKTELEEEKGKVLKLKSQISRDHENSSAPSSLKPNRKKITNNREKTGRRPGGQPGHEGHKRKRHIPTSRINIPAPKAYTDNPIYKPTGKTISKQLVDIRVEIIVNEYCTPEFRHMTTRQRVHADFPEGLADEVNYGSNLRAFAFLLNNHCNVSVLKVSDFLSELTGGKLRISAGMINGLPKVYAQKTKAEQNKAFADLLLSPVVNFDFSSARVNGQKFNVAVCATPSTSMYFARERKGHEGIAGTPIEHHQGILVHDHDKTLYSYGSNHQECSDHILRYLLGSMQNEPKLKWSQQMRGLFQEMIHFRKSLDSNDNRNPDQICPGRVDELEAMYDEILNNAKAEYEYEPPSKYYMDGINLYKRLDKYKANHLLFLHDKRVPHSNSLSERLLRIFKRKQAQAMTFRSYECLDYLCQSLGAMASYRAQGCNLYESTASVFSRTINRDGTVSN